MAGRGGSDQFAVARYNPDGSPDGGFGSGGSGVATTDLSGAEETAHAIIVQPDAQIVVAGRTQTTGNGSFALARYNSDGTPNSGFSGGEVVTAVGNGGDSGAHALAPVDGGKVVAAGYARDAGIYKLALARYDSNGALDGNFGSGGTALVPGGDGGEAAATALKVQGDGKLIVTGVARDGGTNKLLLARFNPDGSPDGSFGSGGLVLTPVGDGDDVAGWSLAIQGDGKLVAAGHASDGQAYRAVVARYNPDGSLDAAFGSGGVMLGSLGDEGNSAAHSVAVQADGNVVAAGTAALAGAVQLALVRLRGAGDPLDVAPPNVAASMTNKRFLVGRKRTAVSAARKKVPTGTKFRITLSEPAQVSVRIERGSPGRLKGKKCVKPRRSLRKRKRCTRWARQGTLTRRLPAGRSTVSFSGRIGKKALRAGKHRALVTAVDGAGNRSRQRTLKFTVVAKAKKSDRRDGPIFEDTPTNGRLDVGEIYAFRSPANANNTVLAMTVSPFTGVSTPAAFQHGARYELKVDRTGDNVEDVTLRGIFGPAAGDNSQSMWLRCLPAPRCPNRGIVAGGSTAKNVPSGGFGGLVRTGNQDDPYFFDQAGWDAKVDDGGGTFPRAMGTAKNFYHPNGNTLAILVEVASNHLAPNNEIIRVWGRTLLDGAQRDREGRPFINTGLIPPVPRNDLSRGDRRNAFNAGHPFNDVNDFKADMVAELTGFYGRTASDANNVSNFLLPDVNPFQVGNPNGFGAFLGPGGSTLGNGRRLRDDALDTILNFTSNGAIVTDNVPDDNGTKITDGNMGTIAAFPYIGAPNASPGGPNP